MHRDLKPENILVNRQSDSNSDPISVKLTDFGFAAKYDHERQDKTSLGSPAYMAPELWKREAHSMKVDCWAVGVIAFQLISGKFPFVANDKRTLGKKISLEEPNYSFLLNAS